jgi:hypothetical protein
MEKGAELTGRAGTMQPKLCPPRENCAFLQETDVDKALSEPLFGRSLLGATLPGSSVVEQVTVNHLVAGSIPARAANLKLSTTGFEIN